MTMWNETSHDGRSFLDDRSLATDFATLVADYQRTLRTGAPDSDKDVAGDGCVRLAGKIFGPTSFTMMIRLATLADAGDEICRDMGEFLQSSLDMIEDKGGIGWLYRLIYVSCPSDFDPSLLHDDGSVDDILVPMAAQGRYSEEHAQDVCRVAAHVILVYGARNMEMQSAASLLLRGRYQDALDIMETRAGVFFRMEGLADDDEVEGGPDASDDSEGVSEVDEAGEADGRPRIPVAGLDSLGMLDDDDDDVVPRRIQQAIARQAGVDDSDLWSPASQDPTAQSSRKPSEEKSSDDLHDDRQDGHDKDYPSGPSDEKAKRLPYPQSIPFYLYTLDKVLDHLGALFPVAETKSDGSDGSAETDESAATDEGSAGIADAACGTFDQELGFLSREMDRSWEDRSYLLDQLASLVGKAMADHIVKDADDRRTGVSTCRQVLGICDTMVREEGIFAIPLLLVNASESLIDPQTDAFQPERFKALSLGYADAASVLLNWIPDPDPAMPLALLIMDGNMEGYQRQVRKEDR